VLRDTSTAFSIITRGPMVVRDVEILAAAAARASVAVTFSVPTVDDEIWRRTEPGTAPPHQRLRAVRTLVDAGIRTGVGMAPLLPGLSDDPRELERVVVAAREAGACGIWANLLYLKPGTREHFLECLARDWPELLPEYEELYDRRAYLPNDVARPAKETVRRLAKLHGIADRRPEPLRPPARDEQLSLLSA
jgi:DNA repair photolyase